MTNEELERAMHSITEWQEVAAKHIAAIAATQAEHAKTQAEHAETQAEHAKTQAEHAETQAEHDERIKRFERSYSTIAELLQRHDAQLTTVTNNSNTLNEVVANLAVSLAEAHARIAEAHVRIAETNVRIAETNASVDRLSATVDRYITARSNNGSNGAGDD